jgi:hypothetical protein
MKQKHLLIVLALLVFLPAVGFALPHLAVLEAVLDAGIDPAAGPLVTSKIEEAFVNSGKYTVLDRANIDRVLQEKEFQLSSGIVRNEEVRQAGEYLGADAVVVATVSRIGQTFVVSAKMIDVVSGEIAAQTSAEKAGRIDVLLEVARLVGGRLAGTDIFIVSVDEERAQELTKEQQKAPPKEKQQAPEKQPQAEKQPAVEEQPPAQEEESGYVAPVRPKRPWEKPFIVGARAGLSGSTIPSYQDYYIFDPVYTMTNIGDPYAAFGINVGVYMIVNFGRYLGLQMEMDFAQKGYQFDYEAYDGFNYWPATNRWVFNYLEVPILLKFKAPGRVSPYGILGGYLSLFLNGTVENVFDEQAAQDFFDQYSPYSNPADFADVGVEFNPMDFGWVAGVGVDFAVGSLIFNAELKYSGGLGDAVSDDLRLVYFSNGSVVLSVGAGWAF